MEMKYYH